MKKFFQSSLGMLTLFALGALAVYAIAAGMQATWNPFMPVTTTPAGDVPVLDANGNRTRRFIPSVNISVTKQRSCCTTDGGFIGNCKYPIKPTDNVPPCMSASL